jgi:hypothetical protein
VSASWRQRRYYVDEVTIWRFTESIASTGKVGARTWAQFATGVMCWVRTGESVKESQGPILAEGDNMFSYDKVMFLYDQDVRAGDVLKVTTGEETGSFFTVRGDGRVRNRFANKLMVRVNRTPKAPSGVS